jgi:serine transporter
MSISQSGAPEELLVEHPIDVFSWVLTLFGTAVGAGILFLPIQVGQSGFWALFLVVFLIYPTINLGHRFYALLPSQAEDDTDFITAVGRWLPPWGALLLHLFFIGWLLILLIAYSISLTNDLSNFLSNQGWLSSNIGHRIWLSFALLTSLTLLLRFTRPMLIRILGALTLLLILLLCLITAALIPHWSWSIASHTFIPPTPAILLKQFLLLFPLLTLSFIFFPTLSKLVSTLRNSIPNQQRRQAKLYLIIRLATMALMLFVLLFVFSFLLAIPKAEFSIAAHKNISALALLGSIYQGSWLGDLGPAISVLALITSFLGIFIGYRESLLSLFKFQPQVINREVPPSRHENMLHCLTFVILWILAIANVPVMDILGDLVAPLGAIFLLVVPAGVVLFTDEFHDDKGPTAWFVLVTGALVITAYFIGTSL